MNVQETNYGSLTMIVDSGSTKTDWCVCCNGKKVARYATQGINPFHQSEETIRNIIGEELVANMRGDSRFQPSLPARIKKIRFYGAGCRGKAIDDIRSILTAQFPSAGDIIVGSDLLAAAHAVCGGGEGIACILGTGANSGLFDGMDIIENVSPLGYVLGDEGSGAVLGKLFVNGLFKGNVPTPIKDEFLIATGQTLDDIIRRVYREPMANRYLASLSPFIHEHIDCREIEEIVVHNFIDFFRLNVDHYKRKDLPVGAVGSIAFYYEKQFKEAARSCGYTVGKIVKSPIDALMSLSD